MDTTREIAETIKTELAQGGELSQALGTEETARVCDQISDVLARGDAGEQIDDELIAVLAVREATRARLDALLPDSLSPGERSGFGPLAGHSPYPPGVRIYRCPKCAYEWPRFDVGETVGECPTHNVPLIPSDG